MLSAFKGFEVHPDLLIHFSVTVHPHFPMALFHDPAFRPPMDPPDQLEFPVLGSVAFPSAYHARRAWEQGLCWNAFWVKAMFSYAEQIKYVGCFNKMSNVINAAISGKPKSLILHPALRQFIYVSASIGLIH